jgi:4-hydroxy-tetrahydrodipicolinate reductase
MSIFMSDTIHVALVGFGKMGRIIAKHAPEFDVAISHVITSDTNVNGDAIRGLGDKNIDILIDFTAPDAVFSNIKAACEMNLSIVVGTTGWYDNLSEVETIVGKSGIGFFYASNFSIGVNVLFRLVRQTVDILNGFPEYDVYIQELHHAQKKDSPSGTAITLGSIVLDTSVRKKSIVTGIVDGTIDPETLQISSTRAGSIIGTHKVGFDSGSDALELIHSAKNRDGFALGALRATRWLRGKSGIFTMDDLLQIT